MAQGTQVAFDTLSEATGELIHDFTPTTGDTIKVALVSEAIGAITTQTNLSQLSEVTGTGYTAGGETSAITAWSRTGAVSSLGLSDVGWAQDPAGPTNIKTAIVWNSSKVGQDDMLTFIDLTVDNGTTAISLIAGALNINLSTNPPIQVTRN